MRRVYRTEVCIHTLGTRGYAFLYVLPRYEAQGSQDWCVISRFMLVTLYCQFSMELMLFRRGRSAIVCNSEVYVVSRVVISRFDL